MAEGKKSFIAYSDWHGTFKALPDEIAGQLIKYIFSYVNDEEPKPHENYVVNALFEQVKATLKRDLNKWDKQRDQRSQAGKKSAELRATKSNDRSTLVNEKVRKATVSVNDSVNVNVSDNDNLLGKDKKEIFNSWLLYRKEIKKEIKASSTIDSLIKKFNAETLIKCKSVVNASIENNYQGLFWDNHKANKINKPSKITF